MPTSEIYRIVSQRSLHDPNGAGDDDNPIRRPNNVENITVKPTTAVNADNVRRQCCNS